MKFTNHEAQGAIPSGSEWRVRQRAGQSCLLASASMSMASPTHHPSGDWEFRNCPPILPNFIFRTTGLPNSDGEP